jgi:hypothetical protein
VTTGDLKTWLAIRDRLAAIPSIQQTEILAIDRQRALVSLHYVGDAAQLKTALAQRNLDLSGEDPNWLLRQSGAQQNGAAPVATPAQ